MNSLDSLINKSPKAADMLDTIRHEAAELRNFTITFLSFLMYLSLIVAATDHEQILHVSPVNLPLLNVSLPILGFYWFMPPFLFCLHLYILIQHYLFSQFAFCFDGALSEETPEMQQNIRTRLGNLPFLHWLLGQHGSVIRVIMMCITVISLIIWPVFMFWWMQARFLPYHDSELVLWQQSWLTLDTFVLAYLWAKTLDENDNAWNWWKQITAFQIGISQLVRGELRHILRVLVAWRPSAIHFFKIDSQEFILPNRGYRLIFAGTARLGLTILILMAWFFSWAVSLVPDSLQEISLKRELSNFEKFSNLVYFDEIITEKSADPFGYDKPKKRLLFKPTAWLHEKRFIPVDGNQFTVEQYDPARILQVDCPEPPSTKQKNISTKDDKPAPRCYQIDGWLPRNLILRSRVLTADGEVKPEISNRLRSFNAILNENDLMGVSPINLHGRNLDYADFSNSSLPRADLRRASLKYANLENSKFVYADLSSAHLDEANLTHAKLYGAIFTKAQLTKAKLDQADLSGGADLSEANLAGAGLTGTNLINANLSKVNLIGSNLLSANLVGADLPSANLARAVLADTDLSGSYLVGANMAGAYLSLTNLSGADLTEVDLSSVNLKDTLLFGALASLSEKNGTPCVFYDTKPKTRPMCIVLKKANKQQKDKIYDLWKKLACKHEKIGKRMVVRVYTLNEPDLAIKLNSAFQDTKNCLGLAELTENVKQSLHDSVLRQVKARKP